VTWVIGGRLVCTVVWLGVLGACGERPDAASRATLPFAPVYQGIETRLLDGELVGFIVSMQGARDLRDVEDYARCAAAQYTLIRGYAFARHVRTRVEETSGLWRGDAIYTISPSLPNGVQQVDAEVTVSDCAERGIPTV